jgi:hypothetical protein
MEIYEKKKRKIESRFGEARFGPHQSSPILRWIILQLVSRHPSSSVNHPPLVTSASPERTFRVSRLRLSSLFLWRFEITSFFPFVLSFLHLSVWKDYGIVIVNFCLLGFLFRLLFSCFLIWFFRVELGFETLIERDFGFK